MANPNLVSTDYVTAVAQLKQSDSTLSHVMDRVGECLLFQEQRTGSVFQALCESIIGVARLT
jgi:3-methyladenine DNA glycosylase/8-oxoguanine DNA glycosylase